MLTPEARFDECECGHVRHWHDRMTGRCQHHCGPGTECNCERFRYFKATR